jgi:hypothetical protein
MTNDGSSESILRSLRAQTSRKIQQCLAGVDARRLEKVIRTLGQANRIFLFDAGRSGVSLRNPGFLSRNRGMLGMRLVHAGLLAHFVSDCTTQLSVKAIH